MKINLLKFLLCLSSLAFITTSNAQMQPIEEVFEPAGTFSAEEFTKVAVLQWAPNASAPIEDQVLADQFKANNISILESYIREAAAKGAKYISTPEFGIVGYPDIPELPPAEDNFRNREDIKPYVETVPGKSSNHFSNLALELGVYIQFGMAEKDSVTDLYYNTVVVIDPNGEVAAKYRKQHLFQIEHDYLEEGTSNVTFQTPFGKVGLVICSDVYDYSVLEKYKLEQIDVLSLSTSWTENNTGWGYFTTAATKTSAYVLAANHDYYPDSGVIYPDGTTQSHIRQSTGLAYGYLPNK
ncbi:MAG: hypothetical protein COW01_12930 [Bdellovibrionales bacterium CG12_big_fil_rev_8_21_14_0_65_38_15]|nr:MAG: hypothetical protein COW79_08690 [Bdellovibrionales bacterium CG22_combo_CG10-13_8_21_14_all_38_13]PIQ53527.1 MAG: hypothetical protein COW01_12930 [Bdellovibrionales bacterium CG12_big_fil_rev_8_21_14_0_65_38_15]PIR28469.1 MAG: hypothetical protein COV38_15710 [Bdellovibrionales bacterium CG11_big_fil_rev_8_21_14_0_20_38_13]